MKVLRIYTNLLRAFQNSSRLNIFFFFWRVCQRMQASVRVSGWPANLRQNETWRRSRSSSRSLGKIFVTLFLPSSPFALWSSSSWDTPFSILVGAWRSEILKNLNGFQFCSSQTFFVLNIVSSFRFKIFVRFVMNIIKKLIGS